MIIWDKCNHRQWISLGIKIYNKMAQRLINQNHPSPAVPKPNIAIKYRKRRPKPITCPADSETTIETETHHQAIPPTLSTQNSDYIHYLSQQNGQPKVDSILNQANNNGKIQQHVYKLLKRINLGKNFSEYINRKSKTNSKVMFQNSFLAENINQKSNNSSIHKQSTPSKRMNTWMGCAYSPFFKRKSQISSTQCRVMKKQRNKSLPDYNLNKILVATQFQFQPNRQVYPQSLAQSKNGQYQEDDRVKKRRNISYCDIR